MRRQKGPAAVDNRPSICLKSIGSVIDAAMKQNSQEPVRHAVENQFVKWVIDQPTATNKARTEDSVPTFIEQPPIRNDIAAVVAFVGHHNDSRVTGHLIKSERDCSSKPILAGVLNRP